MGDMKEMHSHFLLFSVTKLAVSVLHVSRLCQIPGGGNGGNPYGWCYKGNGDNRIEEHKVVQWIPVLTPL